MPVRSDPRNVGKKVRFTVRRGDVSVERVATIARFRGGRNAHAAFVSYRTPSGHFVMTCVELHTLRYAELEKAQ